MTGPGGEEIYTDKYGRVKVKFHWDREGGRDEKSSCWIRVSSTFAGGQYGSIFLRGSARRWWSTSWRGTRTVR